MNIISTFFLINGFIYNFFIVFTLALLCKNCRWKKKTRGPFKRANGPIRSPVFTSKIA